MLHTESRFHVVNINIHNVNVIGMSTFVFRRIVSIFIPVPGMLPVCGTEPMNGQENSLRMTGTG